LRIQPASWFIEEHKWRVMDGGNQQRNAFLLSARQLTEALRSLLIKVDAGEEVVDFGSGERYP